MAARVAAIPSPSGGLQNASFSCPPQPLHRLAGEWRLFINSGSVRDVSIGTSGPYAAELSAAELPSAPLLRTFSHGGLYAKYTEMAAEVLLPAIDYESADDDFKVRRYRLFSRLCRSTGIMELEDLEGEGQDFAWRHLQAVALRRRPSLPDLAVPFVVAGHLFVQAIHSVLQTQRLDHS
ncbi:RH46 [Symbiodinium natans]|uniref:RH46 protein n=1 Tax=Symbiodinium natans TaxID=878477 RepID=A0A812SCK6_9DINO|nr:RH46 [Symbiodinium natans]